MGFGMITAFDGYSTWRTYTQALVRFLRLTATPQQNSSTNLCHPQTKFGSEDATRTATGITPPEAV